MPSSYSASQRGSFSSGPSLPYRNFTDASSASRDMPSFSISIFNGSNYDEVTNTLPISGTVAATQSGSWTVLPGNTANTTAWLVTGTGGIFPASQSGTWNITNVSGTISLPTGAATAAKQPSLGTAGTASADVITVQGIASMTALKVDGSAVTQPISGSLTNISGTISLPTGAATESTVSSINSKITACNTGAVVISGVVDITPSSPAANDYLPVRLTNGSGFYEVSSNGGSGTQYTQGDVEPSGVIGTAIMASDGSNMKPIEMVNGLTGSDPNSLAVSLCHTGVLVTGGNPLPTYLATAAETRTQYGVNDIDATSEPKYYGFEDKSGSWYIMRESGETYRYAAGSSNYSTAWSGRVGQTYSTYGSTF